MLLSATAQQAEDVEEKIDKVEIKRKTAHQYHLHGRLFVHLAVLCHQTFYLLRVLGGESSEDDHTSKTDEEIEHGISPEHIHHESNDESDDCHREDAPHH